MRSFAMPGVWLPRNEEMEEKMETTGSIGIV